MAKNYCFTDFTMKDWGEMFQENGDILNYVCRGQESCPDTGRRHYQGWVQFNNRTRFNTALKILGGHVALFRCRGNEEQNNKYCRKDNDFQCWGKYTIQGQRTDLTTMVLAAKNCDIPLEEVADMGVGSWLRYQRGFKDFRQMAVKRQTDRWRDVSTEIYYGKTGIGKTRKAKSLGGFLIHADNIDWWDGYEGEDRIIIDEYSMQCKITKLLGLLDGYQMRLAIKGGFTYANWTKVIITTNLTELHTNARDEHRAAFERRINKWVDFDALYGSDG